MEKQKNFLLLIFYLYLIAFINGKHDDFRSDFKSIDSFTSEEDLKIFEELGFWVPPAPPAIREYIENCNPSQFDTDEIKKLQDDIERFERVYHQQNFFRDEQILVQPNEKNPVKVFEIIPLNNPSSLKCDCINELLPPNLVPDIILSSRLNPSKQRFNTFRHTLKLMLETNAKILIETGTSKLGNLISCEHEGCSTIFFGHYAFLTKSKLYSVDNDNNGCIEARKATEQFSGSVEVVFSDSLYFLENFDKGLVDFLYINSFDETMNDSEAFQKRYLDEIKAIYSRLHKKSIILIDDCYLLQSEMCRMANDFLLLQGWTLIMEEYQQLYVFRIN